MHQFPASPLDMVWLRNGFSCEQAHGRTTVKYQRVRELLEALLRAIVLKPARLNGKEIAYVRRSLDFSQERLAALLGVSEQTVSLWERGSHSIQDGLDTLLRKLCIESQPRAFLSKELAGVDALSRLTRSRGSFMYEGLLSGRSWSFFHQLTRQYSTAPSSETAEVVQMNTAGDAQIRLAHSSSNRSAAVSLFGLQEHESGTFIASKHHSTLVLPSLRSKMWMTHGHS